MDKLVDCVDVVTPSLRKYEGRKEYIDTGSVLFSDILESQSFSFDERPSRANISCKAGDVLFAKMKATEKVLLIDEITQNYVYSTGFFQFRVKNKLNPRYLFWYLRSPTFQHQKDKLATGATQKALNLLALNQISAPPLADDKLIQKHVVQILDKADAIRRKRTESLKLLDELLRATFLDIFGDPITNPKGLKKKALKDFGTVVTGNTPSRAEADNYGDYIEWIKSDNLNNPQHYLTKATEGLSEKGARKSRLLPSGSILVTCIAGSPSCIGNAGIADREVAFNQQINAVTPFPHVDLYFLYTQILVAKKLIQSASTNAMKGMINKSKFENIRLLDADENTQKKAGKIFKKIIHEHSVFSNATTESDTLFHSLVARTFKGEL